MSDVDMTGFQSDPFGPSSASLGSGLYGDITNAEMPYYMSTAPVISAQDDSRGNTGGFSVGVSQPSTFDLNATLSSIQKAADWGLKAYGTLITTEMAKNQMKASNYLNTAQIDILKNKSASDVEVSKLNATTNRYIAQAKAAGALSAQNAMNFGTQGGGGVMLWLTVLGVVFAGIQVMKSAK